MKNRKVSYKQKYQGLFNEHLHLFDLYEEIWNQNKKLKDKLKK